MRYSMRMHSSKEREPPIRTWCKAIATEVGDFAEISAAVSRAQAAFAAGLGGKPRENRLRVVTGEEPVDVGAQHRERRLAGVGVEGVEHRLRMIDGRERLDQFGKPSRRHRVGEEADMAGSRPI